MTGRATLMPRNPEDDVGARFDNDAPEADIDQLQRSHAPELRQRHFDCIGKGAEPRTTIVAHLLSNTTLYSRGEPSPVA
jgi:hypothetical protein